MGVIATTMNDAVINMLGDSATLRHSGIDVERGRRDDQNAKVGYGSGLFVSKLEIRWIKSSAQSEANVCVLCQLTKTDKIVAAIGHDEAAFKQYVASSYVKWVEMAGGVAVPMSYVASNATTLNLLKQLDGVLLPGGSNPPLPDAARVSVEYALEASSRNESFPVWGTCLGFEWLVEILALIQREKST